MLSWLRLALAAAVFGSGVWVGLEWSDDTVNDLLVERAQNDRDEARADLDAHLAQAERDRKKLESIQAARTKAEQAAEQWKQRWKNDQRDPEILDWASTNHPPAVGDRLRDP